LAASPLFADAQFFLHCRERTGHKENLADSTRTCFAFFVIFAVNPGRVNLDVPEA
jgi:hypothetical protein